MGLTEKFLYLNGLKTHREKVKALYKRALRSTQSFMHNRAFFRYEAAVLRDRFEHNRKITNFKQAQEMLRLGEDELLYRGHWNVRQFPPSQGGSACEREVILPDWMLDYWHPLEKAQYPEYFCTRECRKQQFPQWWEEHVGKEEPIDLKELLKKKKGRGRVC